MAYSSEFFDIAVFGDRAILRNLEQMPATVRAILLDKIQYYSEKVRAQVEDNIDARLNKSNKAKVYSGAIGHLRDAIMIQPAVANGEKVEAYVYVDESIPYARIQEEGGTTPSHMIFPRNGRVLAFEGVTGKVFATRVFHPGGTIPATHYMRDAYRMMSPSIGKAIQRAVVAGIRQNMRNS